MLTCSNCGEQSYTLDASGKCANCRTYIVDSFPTDGSFHVLTIDTAKMMAVPDNRSLIKEQANTIHSILHKTELFEAIENAFGNRYSDELDQLNEALEELHRLLNQ